MPKSLLELGILTAVALMAAPGLALAESTLTLVVGGEGFDGPPKFSVSFDGKPLGDSAVASAIDTSKDGRFADAVDKSKYIQTFTFKLADDTFKPDGAIAIKLTNEAHGAAGGKDDRELYVQSVAVNGDVVPGTKLAMRSSVGVEPKAILGDYLVIAQSDVEGIATPPDGGWPKAAAPVAEAAAADAKPVADAVPAKADSGPAKTEVAEVAPAAKAAATATDAVDSPDANPNPEAKAPDCGIAKSFQIIGFSRNSNDLTAKTREALDVVAKTIGTQKC
ncbi:MAG: carbohydrate-binding domain-containing protein, partial [Devosia sp.]